MDRLIDRQINGQMDGQIGKWTEAQMDGLSGRATASQMDRWTDRPEDIQMIGRQMGRQKWTDLQTSKQRDFQTINRQIDGNEDILTNRPIII